MFVPPLKPGEKPSKLAVYTSMVCTACLIVLFIGLLTRPIPARESLASFDASGVPLVLEGKELYMVTIRSAADTELRSDALQRETADELRRLLAAGRHRVTVLSTANNLYLGFLWGGPRYDRTIMELTVDQQVVIGYEESVAEMRATRWQGIIVVTLTLGYSVWYFVRNVRQHAFAPKPAGGSAS